jgi:hypothetical protein
MHPTLRHMIKYGVPITRENYIASNWGTQPEDWGAEHEAELPPHLRASEYQPDVPDEG